MSNEVEDKLKKKMYNANFTKRQLNIIQEFLEYAKERRTIMKEPLNIEIKYFNKDVEHIEKIAIGDWIDLRAAEDVDMNAGELRPIKLGIGMILPEGYEAHLLPRSSTAKNFGILCANSMGVVDNSYSGDEDEWMFLAYAIRGTIIKKGSRICQFRIMPKMPEVVFKVVDKLNDISRGGYGSTGVK